MHKTSGSLSVAICLAGILISFAPAQTDHDQHIPPQRKLLNQLLDGHRLDSLQNSSLQALLGSIASANQITTNGDLYWTLSKEDRPSIIIVPLQDLKHPTDLALLCLYYLPSTGQHFFLQSALNPDTGSAEVRLWSATSDNEILITEAGLRFLTTPSKFTFRIPHGKDASSDTALSKGDRAASLSPVEIITCLAKTLGIDVTTTNWSQLLGSLACSATTTFGTVQTLLACLSIPGVGSNLVFATAGCIAGVGQLISCGYVNCSTVASDFSLTGTPSSQSVVQGGVAVFTITMNPSGGFSSPVSGFTVSNLHPGATYRFTADSITSSGDATQLLITTNGNTSVDDRQLTITASGGGLTRSATVRLNVTRSASGDGIRVLTNGQSASGNLVNGQADKYKFAIPSGTTQLTVSMSGTGDADLYLQWDHQPTANDWYCRPYASTANETCSFPNPWAGDWYIMVNGYSSSSSYTLTLNYAVGTAGPRGPAAPNMEITFTPNPVSRSSTDGKWYYTTTIKETNGVALTLTGMTIGGSDYTNKIAEWFGATGIPPNGQLSSGMVSSGSSGDRLWVLTSSTGQSWSRAVTLLP